MHCITPPSDQRVLAEAGKREACVQLVRLVGAGLRGWPASPSCEAAASSSKAAATAASRGSCVAGR
ncbi:hypothetical protein DIPPA_07019 [Diplonema papillatum]|nr:hypothetical protein DIPPA_19004 [Diplonema papillatum]KAJ9445364.1 hypothetical protein DIPPA_07019 [Diplonema papillatum]